MSLSGMYLMSDFSEDVCKKGLEYMSMIFCRRRGVEQIREVRERDLTECITD